MRIIPFALVVFGVTACGEDHKSESDHPHPHPGAAEKPADHGSSTDLGTLTVAGKQFGIVRLGDLVPGKEGAFEVHPKGIAAAELAGLNVYLWVESQDGTQLSAAAKGSPEGDALHFHMTPRKSDKAPFRVILRLRADGTDERAGLPLDGHGHEHHDGPHQGVPASFRGGDVTGHLELKLHDDKGDLELWLGEDAEITRPFDLPLDARAEIEFVDVGGRKVTLRPRNRTRNELAALRPVDVPPDRALPVGRRSWSRRPSTPTGGVPRRPFAAHLQPCGGANAIARGFRPPHKRRGRCNSQLRRKSPELPEAKH